MRLLLWCFLAILLSPFSGQALDTLEINYEAYILNYIDLIPPSFTDEFIEPTNAEMIRWDSCFMHLLREEYNLADIKAQSLNYRLDLLIDTISSDTFYGLERQASGPHWGLYLFNPKACRSQLVFMAPHPKKDLNTGLQAAYCFQNTEAGLLMISGTNRCNSSQFSSCSGSTSVCGTSEDYRISDLAHNENSVFQQSCATILDEHLNPYFIQLHGFSKKETDPYLIMSNGTRDTPSYDPIEKLARYLLIKDTLLSSKIGHLDPSWSRLLGFTNTNGRLINNSSAPCNQNATMSAGRFLHIEQEYHRLRKDSLGWDKMAHALRATFPGIQCDSRTAIDDHSSWFVIKDAVGNGRSWETAHGHLADIMAMSKSGDSICIAQGEYLPDKTRDTASFVLHTSLNLYGGFPLEGGAFAQRDYINNPTVLSGNIGLLDDHYDDIKDILSVYFLEQSCILDGLFIKTGRIPDGRSIFIDEVPPSDTLKLNNIIISKY